MVADFRKQSRSGNGAWGKWGMAAWRKTRGKEMGQESGRAGGEQREGKGRREEGSRWSTILRPSRASPPSWRTIGPLVQAEALIYALAQAEIKSNLVGVWLIVGTQRAVLERDLN